MTYRELRGRAASVAALLRETAGGRRDPVGVSAAEVGDTIVGMLAALVAGLPFIVLDRDDPPARLAHILSDAGVGVILTDLEELSQLVAVAAGSPVVQFPKDAPPGVPSSLGYPTGDDLSHMLYTSGSTGRPKGVVHSHRNLVHKGEMARRLMGLNSSDRVSLLFSPGVGAGISDVFGALLNGAAVCSYDLRAEGFHRLGEWLSRVEVTVLHTVPTVFRRFLEGVAPDDNFPTVRNIVLAGEPVFRRDLELYRRHFADDCVLVHRLSSNETSVVAANVVRKDAPVDGEILPVGRPVEGVRIRLLDEQGRDVAPGAVGEIAVESSHLALGYWRNPELTAAAFSKGMDGKRLFRSRDLGRFRPDGELEFLGRKDDRMKIHGHTIEPREVEQALQRVGRFKEVKVVGRRENNGDQQIVAYLVPDSDIEPSPARLRRDLAKLIPDYMVPSRFVSLDSLPLTPLGKVDRTALPDVGGGRDTDALAPRSDLEKRLADIWAEVLGIEVGVDEDFFDLGGTSMQALQVFAKIARNMGVDIPSTTLLEAPTVEALATIITEGRWGSLQDSLVTVKTGGGGLPFFCVHGGGGGVLFLRDLAKHLPPDRPIYGLQARGFESRPGPYRTVEELAAQYLAEVREAQPHGPYLLGGLSFGGKVAYEMARQLTADGEEVDLLVLFDTKFEPTEYDRGARGHLDRLASLGLLGRLSYLVSGASRRTRRVAKQMLLRYYLARGRRIPETFGLRNLYFYPMHSRANREYVPRHYPGDVVVIARQGMIEGHRQSWGSWVGGSVQIHEVECGHHDLMREPYVSVVAAHLAGHLPAH